MFTALNTTTELKQRRPRLAILPIGATEQHSHHLPLATDTLVVEAVARRVAQKLNAYCLPALPFSISHMHRGCPGTVWLRNSTLAAVAHDLAVSLLHEGFSQFVLFNGHGGNFILMPIVQDLNLEFPKLLTMTHDAWIPVVTGNMFPQNTSFLHGDEFETSCLLDLCKETVRKNRLQDQTKDPDRELLRYMPFSRFSRLTHTGKPTRATAEKGRLAVDLMVEHAVRNIQATLRKVKQARKRR